jgi:hypothetical protein
MNIIEYTVGATKTFSEKPFTPVDSLVLSQLSYTRFEAVVDGEGRDRLDPRMTVKDFFLGEYFPEMFSDGISDEDNRRLLAAAACSPRFRDLTVKNIVTKSDRGSEEQFAAMMFEIGPLTDYVAFRGTDGSLYGWKEDFNLSFMDEVPAQRDAADYIDRFCGGKGLRGRRHRYYIGGHSKGGNLAVYSALSCDPGVRERVIEVFSHDGPGFRDEVLDRLEAVRERDGVRVTKEVPQTSMIGILLETQEDYRVVKSDGFLIMQHSAYTWQIEDGDFIYLDDKSGGGRYFDRTLHEWIANASDEEREVFSNTLYKVLSENGIKTLHDMKSMDIRKVIGMLETIGDLEPGDRKIFLEMFKKLAEYSLKCLPDRDDQDRTDV